MTEYFDVIDKYGNLTGETVSREEAHNKGIRHHTAHVWIVRFNPVEDKWQVLLRLRTNNTANKNSFPTMWDTSCAGHIYAGESINEGMLRELKEELGITATAKNLIPIDKLDLYYTESFGGKAFIDNELAYISCYKMRYKNSKYNVFKYDRNKIQGIYWFDMLTLKIIVDDSNYDNCICAPTASIKTLLKHFKI